MYRDWERLPQAATETAHVISQKRMQTQTELEGQSSALAISNSISFC